MCFCFFAMSVQGFLGEKYSMAAGSHSVIFLLAFSFCCQVIQYFGHKLALALVETGTRNAAATLSFDGAQQHHSGKVN